MNSKKLNQRIEETGLLFGFCLRRLRRLQNASSSYLDGLAFFCTFGPKGAKRYRFALGFKPAGGAAPKKQKKLVE